MVRRAMQKTSRRKSWSDKLADGAPHKVKRLDVDMAGMKAGQIMLIPSARIVDDAIRAIGAGEFIDVPTLRRRLASEYGAEVCCPITTGILLRVVAEAAIESNERDAPDVTPFWRVIDETTPLAAKLSCGREFIAGRRRRERPA